ncbi:MAG: ATP-binding protein [Candidatus Margulisiibacteriota bacterium]|jgi:hypothetical protein
MLIEFSVANFRSIKERITLSMVAGSLKNELSENVISRPELTFNLLKSAVIYGANASGKSNLILALKFMRYMILSSAKESQSSELIPDETFKLSEETENVPSAFEIVFVCDGVRYRYGFEVTPKNVVKEYLFHVPKKIETVLFSRSNQVYELKGIYKKEAKDIVAKTRENTLLLSAVAQWNGEISRKITDWFMASLNCISGNREKSYPGFTIDKCENDNTKKQILDLLKIADLGIDGFEVEEKEVPFEDLPEGLRRFITSNTDKKPPIEINIYTNHTKYNTKLEPASIVKFDLDEIESEGTKKLFALAGPILDTLSNGKTLIVDEMDSKLHPLLTQTIIKLFHSTIINPKNAQLIFATHDTNILTHDFFRRDQIWFTEKNKYGATDLYSLQDYKISNGSKIRKDATYAKDYILGKYGAIPFIGDFYSVFKKSKSNW